MASYYDFEKHSAVDYSDDEQKITIQHEEDLEEDEEEEDSYDDDDYDDDSDDDE